ncbi:hypothetical protein MB27_05290 [Actinoplanes utahensis]|uniref:Carrier domain-containing protein n=1 Tax=Actinoplanes utahensis TaxID=1869 RepID=A0A0A6UTU6_ACTUT|nr:hypothetical protein MB27_05290 [Actinoplanes utahensis]
MPWDDSFEKLLRPLLPLLPPRTRIVPELDLVAAGLDSFGVVELLAEVEDHYGILLDDEEITAQAVESPATLWRIVSAHLTAEAPGHG